MTPAELKTELRKLVQAKILDPAFIVGEPGVGKSSIAYQIAEEAEIGFWDVRWAQLGPADARGVPVPDVQKRITEFLPPSFWPKTGPGIIFLDEFNMATPAMMGLAQQLLLDRKFGDYTVPEGVFIWAAGNRKVDLAAVHELPAPVANRMAHYEVTHDFPSWELWAYAHEIHVDILSFLKFQPQHLFKLDEDSYAWPSGRSWEMADRRYKAGMSVDPVIGENMAAPFRSHLTLLESLPNMELVVQGKGKNVSFPSKPDLRHAVISHLEMAAYQDPKKLANCLVWLVESAAKSPEYIQMFVTDVLRIVAENKKLQVGKYFALMDGIPEVKSFLKQSQKLIAA